MSPITLQPQEVSFDDARSACFFQPSATKPFLATPAAIELFGQQTIFLCLLALQRLAQNHHGIDYLQVFVDPAKSENLWFIEDGEGGAITALLPSDY